jgi:iron complex transport system substrate-binding protein
VAAGAAAEVDYVSVVGLNTPTPLSIPFSLEVVRPTLEAAAA